MEEPKEEKPLNSEELYNLAQNDFLEFLKIALKYYNEDREYYKKNVHVIVRGLYKRKEISLTDAEKKLYGQMYNCNTITNSNDIILERKINNNKSKFSSKEKLIIGIPIICLLILTASLIINFINDNEKEEKYEKQIEELKEKEQKLAEKNKKEKEELANRLAEQERREAREKQQLREQEERREKAKTDFGYLYRKVKARCEQGASQDVALGEYQNLEVNWRVKIDYVCYGLSGTPVQFSKENVGILGFPSYGMDEYKFVYLCQGNEDKWCNLKGRLKKATDNKILSGKDKDMTYVMEVTSIDIE